MVLKKFKKTISIVLSILFMVSILPSVPALAAYEGSCGDGVNYSFDGSTGELTISGSGNMKDYESFVTPWYSYKYDIKKVTIENGVTSIGNSAFESCRDLNSIDIPPSVTSIGNYAFSSCWKLTNFLPNTSRVISIGDGACFACDSLPSVTIPSSVTSIGTHVFGACTKLTSISVDVENTTYKDIDGVLFSKDGTQLISYPAGKQGVNYAIPSNVTNIVDSAFSSCWKLTGILTIPDSVTSIEDNTFFDCRGLTSVTIPNSVTSIGNMAFMGCRGLTSITIPGSVTSIEEKAFSDCSGLTSLTIEDGVTSIGGYAFSCCDNLPSITIPGTVTSIGGFAFCYCTELTTVTYRGTSEPEHEEEIFISCDKFVGVMVPYNYGSEHFCEKPVFKLAPPF